MPTLKFKGDYKKVIFNIPLKTDAVLPFTITGWRPSRVVLLLHCHISVSGQDSRDFSLHEGPRHSGPSQGTALSTGAVHLTALTLAAYESSGTWEAELVVWDRGTLDKMSVLQALSAEGAAEQSALCTACGLPSTSVGAWSNLPQGCLGD